MNPIVAAFAAALATFTGAVGTCAIAFGVAVTPEQIAAVATVEVSGIGLAMTGVALVKSFRPTGG